MRHSLPGEIRRSQVRAELVWKGEELMSRGQAWHCHLWCTVTLAYKLIVGMCWQSSYLYILPAIQHGDDLPASKYQNHYHNESCSQCRQLLKVHALSWPLSRHRSGGERREFIEMQFADEDGDSWKWCSTSSGCWAPLNWHGFSCLFPLCHLLRCAHHSTGFRHQNKEWQFSPPEVRNEAPSLSWIVNSWPRCSRFQARQRLSILASFGSCSGYFWLTCLISDSWAKAQDSSH